MSKPEEIVTPEVVEKSTSTSPEDAEPKAEKSEASGTVSEPAKVMRIGTMIRQLLEEVRSTELDEAGRDRLKEIYETSLTELSSSLSGDLQDELNRLTTPFADDDVPSGAELRVAQAQLVGWLEGLFHGIQATLFAQQSTARQQLENMNQPQVIPPGGGNQQQSSGGVYL